MNDSGVVIREAVRADFTFVSELMHNALEPYYGGDHRAHAKRIHDAHIDGGHDRVGFFSFEQKMFIVEVGGVKAGMIHMVGKRQSTYKISPLIVAPEYQGGYGLGSILLEYAEQYVQQNNARQLYCTVADKNKAAMQFFVRKGFIKAGSSDSHYKHGVTETMLYKPMYEVSDITSLDQLHVSVIPFDETNSGHKKQVVAILLEKLPISFEGIDGNWVSALFNGYSRRHTADINSKYKLIFLAIDSDDQVIGVAAATPKKGSPIKVMPFIAVNMAAFEALLIDIPHQLLPYGHKLYVHINPTADEVVAMQRLNWKLDSAMPSAYRPGIVTQQWSIDIGETTMRSLRVKKRYYDAIVSGQKTVEVRVGYDTINSIKVGELIKLVTHTSSAIIKVNSIRNYSSFEKMLLTESYEKIAPTTHSADEVLQLLRDIYPPEKERLGVVVLEISVAR